MASIVLVLGLLAVVPATAGAVIDVTHGPWAGVAGSDVLIVTGHAPNDDVAVATFLPNGQGTGDDQVRISSPSAAQDILGPADSVCNPVGDDVVCGVGSLGDHTIVMGGYTGDDSLTFTGAPHPGYTVVLFGGLGHDTLVGGPGDETFYGDKGDNGTTCFDATENPTGTDPCNDTIRDGLGADHIIGEGGSDSVEQSALGAAAAATDSDVIELGDGSLDRISYAARDASNPVVVRPGVSNGSGSFGEHDDIRHGAEWFVGTAGDDTFDAGATFYPARMEGGAGDDTFRASTNSEEFSGGPGTDLVSWASISGPGISATPDGAANDGNPAASDVDDLGADVELLIGSDGNDTMQGAAVAGCRVAGGLGVDAISAPASGCILEGGDDADALVGGPGADVLRPGASGTAASDDLTFAGGDDVVEYAALSMAGGAAISGVQASAASGAAGWCGGIGVGATTSARVLVGGEQHLEVWRDAPERIVGTSGADTICGGPAGTILDAGAGTDTVLGGTGPDTLLAGPGNDLANGQGGADSVDGGEGSDNVNGGAGPDVVDGGPGDDTHVRGGGGSDTIRGGDGNDVLDEVTFSAVLAGGAETEVDSGDVLDGGPGTDTVDGNAGNDVIACTPDMFGDSISDSGGGTETIDCSGLGSGITLAAGAGIDRVVGSAFPDTITGASVAEGGPGDDVLVAGAGGSTLDGGDGQDLLQGGDGADMLRGSTGNDRLRGGAGPDVLGGDSGFDDLAGEDGDDALDGGGSGDVLAGGSGADTVSYADRGAGVVVTQDGAGNDGTAGEGDNVRDDVELIVGTSLDDAMATGGTGTHLVGGGGNDRLTGGVGADTLEGGPGSDALAGGG
ncbi:MAG: Proprotein convertase, partial [Thermoleophilia bacterium]|nr:Proprotein convertase [Thermoleophilia bacterium]